MMNEDNLHYDSEMDPDNLGGKFCIIIFICSVIFIFAVVIAKVAF